MNYNTEQIRKVVGQQGEILSGKTVLRGEFEIPSGAKGVVLFAHGSGTSRHSPRNQYLARMLRAAGLGTLLFDLLTEEEEALDMRMRHLRFDIGLLAERLIDATRWLIERDATEHLRVGYFGSSTGAAAALVAATQLSAQVGAVVSRGGRPDLARETLPRVEAATLLVVGERDETVLDLNKQALTHLHCPKELKVIPRASHLFEEAGVLEEMAQIAAEWFSRHIAPAEPASAARPIVLSAN